MNDRMSMEPHLFGARGTEIAGKHFIELDVYGTWWRIPAPFESLDDMVTTLHALQRTFRGSFGKALSMFGSTFQEPAGKMVLLYDEAGGGEQRAETKGEPNVQTRDDD